MNAYNTAIIAIALQALAPAAAHADAIAWDHPGDPRVTHFQLYEDQAEHYRIDGADTREVDMAEANVTPGHEYHLRACSESACSDPSNPLYLPVAPSVHVILQWP